MVASTQTVVVILAADMNDSAHTDEPAPICTAFHGFDISISLMGLEYRWPAPINTAFHEENQWACAHMYSFDISLSISRPESFCPAMTDHDEQKIRNIGEYYVM